LLWNNPYIFLYLNELVMPLNAFANDGAELGRLLGEMSASGSVQVREEGEWLAEPAALHCDLR
jgi:hypothetical protein